MQASSAPEPEKLDCFCLCLCLCLCQWPMANGWWSNFLKPDHVVAFQPETGDLEMSNQLQIPTPDSSATPVTALPVDGREATAETSQAADRYLASVGSEETAGYDATRSVSGR